MKKTLAIILAVLMALSLVACGSGNNGGNDDPGKKDDDPIGQGGENPWAEVNSDTVYQKLGFRFTEPEGATDIVYRWNEDGQLAEMEFVLNDVTWTARAKKTEEFEDISGMDYDWSGNNDNYGHGPDIYIYNENFELRGDYHLLRVGNETDDHITLGCWFYQGATPDYYYSLSLSAITDFGFVTIPGSEVFVFEGAGGSDPVEYGQGYWEERYPGYTICPFYIEVNGVEIKYYWASGSEGYDGRIVSWVDTAFNWNGWHMVGDYIVNESETYRITDESMESSFSSFCTYYTQPFDKDAELPENPDENPEGGSDDNPEGQSTEYNFKGYTEVADWPGEDAWKSFGLPNLPMTEDVNGKVHISDKDWIYPLNGKDGILIEASPAESQIDNIVSIIKDAGIGLEEDSSFNKGYTARYENAGKNMKISVSETELGKLAILIVTEPTD